ncbi:MAG TPA: 50S ribosomal protein L25 [Euzebya sp.]|nr:50S ribosomal protein L25 [Euzebya sp.]
MADQIALTADTRPGDGKGEARALRHEGRVPAVAYGSGLEATPVHVDARDLRLAMSTEAGENAVFRLDIAGDTHLAMAREIHRHPVRRTILHLDFVTINRDKKVHVDVHIVVSGEVEGAIINQSLNSLSIEVLPLEVPDHIDVSVDGLEVGNVIRASDVVVPDGVTVLNDPEQTVVSITVPSEEPTEEEEVAEVDAADVPAVGEDADAAGDEADSE